MLFLPRVVIANYAPRDRSPLKTVQSDARHIALCPNASQRADVTADRRPGDGHSLQQNISKS